MGRIVVNFDPSQAQARRKPRRWARILALVALFIVGAIVVAAVGGFLWWRNYQSKPHYSLALLMDAAEKGNMDEMAKYLDREEIVRNMMAKVSQKAVSRYGGLVSTAAQQKIEQSVTSLPNLNQTIGIEVVSEIQSLAAAQSQPFIHARRLWLPSRKITIEGDLAKASANFGDRTVDVTMRRDGESLENYLVRRRGGGPTHRRQGDEGLAAYRRFGLKQSVV